MTVLFADVVHSMDIAATVGAERLREIMAELVNITTAVVKRYGGTVDKFTGDGIMAVFGAPIALEDHALRACRAALEIHSAITDLAEEVSRRDGVDLQLRVGLNSGQVIAGEIGSGAAGYTTVGEQVGLAQRMESVAPPGGVMPARPLPGWSRPWRPWVTRSWSASRVLTSRCAPSGYWACRTGFTLPHVPSRLWWVGAGRWPLTRRGLTSGRMWSCGMRRSKTVSEVHTRDVVSWPGQATSGACGPPAVRGRRRHWLVCTSLSTTTCVRDTGSACWPLPMCSTSPTMPNTWWCSTQTRPKPTVTA